MAVYFKEAKERQAEDLSAVRDTVAEMIARVMSEGEAAVRFYSKKFDDWSPDSFRISDDEIAAAKGKLPASMVEDIDFCQAQIKNFATAQMETLKNFEVETLPGVHLGRRSSRWLPTAPTCPVGGTRCWPRPT
jgi:sulfopropanediol 3-dehydrogenase